MHLVGQGKERRWFGKGRQGIKRGFTEVCCMKKPEEREYN
jgi:hypothetical protein